MTDPKTTKLDNETLKNITPFSGLPMPQDALAAGRAMQQVKTEYTTAVAVQKPRVMEVVANNVLTEAKLAGAGFYFRWLVFNKDTGKKDKPVQGPAIDLAMCIARNYGNCVIDVTHEETLTHFIMRATFVDLETGFTVPRLFRQRKTQNIGSGYSDARKEDMIFQIAQSKAQRNAIIKAVPGWLVDQAIEVARQADKDGVELAPEKAKAKVMAFFEGYGVTLDRVEAAVGAKVDKWTAENIVDLRGMATGLKEGRVSANELFPESVKEKTKKKVDELKAKLSEKEELLKKRDEIPPPKIDAMAAAANEPDKRLGHQGGSTPQKGTDEKVECKWGCGAMNKPGQGATRHENRCIENPDNAPPETSGPVAIENLQGDYPNIHPSLFETPEFETLANLLKSERARVVWNKPTGWGSKDITDVETLTEAFGKIVKEASRVTLGNHEGHETGGEK